MTESDFQREDREYERQLDHREELEREDICLDIANRWFDGQRIALRTLVEGATARKAPQPVAEAPTRGACQAAALLDSIRDEWEAA